MVGLAQVEEPVYCTMDLCWDGSSRDPRDCSCPEKDFAEIYCIASMCPDGSPRSSIDCSCPDDGLYLVEIKETEESLDMTHDEEKKGDKNDEK